MSDYDWILGIGIPIIIALIVFVYDDVKAPITLFILLNIGLGIMVYAGYVNVGILFISLIASILFTYLSFRSNGG